MAVQVSAQKTVAFSLPYIGKTFQDLASGLAGRDGYLGGGAASDDGVTISISAFTFLQRGIVAAAAAATGIPVPTGTSWFIVASCPDDHPDSGVLLTVTADLAATTSGVVIAFKSGGKWQNPNTVDIAGAAARSSESGPEAGWEVRPVLDNTGVVTAVNVFKGLAVDADGDRRLVPYDATSGNGGLAAALTPVRSHPTRYRTDLAVLRQVERYTASVQHIMGPTGTDTVTPVTLQTVGTPSRAGYFAARGGGLADQWWAWKNGTALRIQAGPAGEGFAAATLLNAAGAIGETWILGQRSADSAIVVLYVDGLLLKMVSFNAATGVQVNAPVTVANTAAQISHVRAVLDGNNTAHITFENDEATQQVYYTSCSIVTGTFGTPAVSPRIVAGAATGTNDTWPSIGIDRRGNVTIAYIQGAGANTFGDLVVATIQGGATQQRTVYAANTEVGVDTKTFTTPERDPGGNGFANVPFASVQQPTVIVTPYDEVYVTLLATAFAGVTYILLWNEDFHEHHGSAMLNIAPELTGATYAALSAVAGEQGEILVAAKEVAPGNVTEMVWWTLNPRPLDTGRIGLSLVRLAPDTIDGRVETSGFTDLLLSRGPTGGFVVNYVLATDILTADINTLFEETLAPHPRDIVLGSWVVPPGTGATISGTSKTFDVFNTRPKRMNQPFLVGDGGVYQGYSSLHQAALEAARSFSEIILRPGRHALSGALTVYGRMRGESRAVLVGQSAIILGASIVAGVVTVVGNIVSSANPAYLTFPPGSIVDLNVSGKHTVLRNLGYDANTATYRLIVDNNAGGAPNGATASLYHGGLELTNITLIDENIAAFVSGLIYVKSGYKAVVRDVRLEAKGSVLIENCIAPTIEGLDLTGLANAATDDALQLSGGDGALVIGARIKDGVGRIKILATCQNPHLIGCHSDGLDGTKTVYSVDGGRTTLAQLTSCTGTLAGDATMVLNARALIDNTYGDPARQLLELVGAPAQAAPLVKLAGVWGTELGSQTVIDGAGEFGATGDHFFDDFYEFNGDQLWTTAVAGDGYVQTANANFSDPVQGAAAHHVVNLGFLAAGAVDCVATLKTNYNIGAWGDRPLFRARMQFGNLTDANLLHVAGAFAVGDNNGHAYFVHDPGNELGLGASNQLRFVLVNDTNVKSSALTGFTPTAGQYYWLWIGYKSATEAHWGISSDLSSSFLASGTLAVGGGVVRTDDFGLRMEIDTVNPMGIGVGVNKTITIDAVHYRSSTRRVS